MSINTKWVVKFSWKDPQVKPRWHFLNTNENVSCPRSGKVDTGYGTRTAVAKFTPNLLPEMCIYCIRTAQKLGVMLDTKAKGIIP